MSRIFWIAAACALALMPAVVQGQGRPGRAPGQPAMVGPQEAVRDARAVTMAKLMKPITIELSESRLEDVVTFIRDFSGAEIESLWIDEKYTEGLDPDKEISLSVNNISVLSFIERVLDKAGDRDYDPAAWQFSEDGALEIGPKSRLNQRSRLEVYDIREMLFTLPDFSEVPSLDLDSVLQQSQEGGGGGGAQSPFGDTPEDDLSELFPEIIDEEAAQELIDIVTTFIEPDQWEDNGGSGGTIRFWQGNLLIRAPDYMHRQIGGYTWWEDDPAVARAVSRESGVSLTQKRSDGNPQPINPAGGPPSRETGADTDEEDPAEEGKAPEPQDEEKEPESE